MTTRKKRPGDFAQRAKMIVDIATGEIRTRTRARSAAVSLGRLGGQKGGRARARTLSAGSGPK